MGVGVGVGVHVGVFMWVCVHFGYLGRVGMFVQSSGKLQPPFINCCLAHKMLTFMFVHENGSICGSIVC